MNMQRPLFTIALVAIMATACSDPQHATDQTVIPQLIPEFK
ncbi:hypothetical protein [Shewanella xiamenensis]|nr:hypothetical protein [Shewanella xiamenensis]